MAGMIGGLPGASNVPRHAVRGGASVPYYNKEPQDAPARAPARARRGGRAIASMPGTNVTVCVCAGAGGTGRTLVATNLAAALHQQRRGRTLLVDAHYPLPGDGPLQLGVDRAKSLADLTPIAARLTPELLESYLITSASGITVLPYVTSYLQHRLLTPGLIQAVLEVARVAYDTVVVDLPTEGTGALQTVLDQADVTCVVVELSPSGGLRTRSTLDLLRALAVPARARHRLRQSRDRRASARLRAPRGLRGPADSSRASRGFPRRARRGQPTPADRARRSRATSSRARSIGSAVTS